MPESVPEKLILVVVGAHIRAELHDRAAAGKVRLAIERALAEKWPVSDDPEQSREDAIAARPRVLILTDLWRLNDPHLAPLPQVVIGHPEVNAVSAFLVDKVPPAFVIDGELAVQFDAAEPEAVAICWGTTHAATTRAAEEFIDRYLDSFADAAIRELAG